VVRPDAVCDGGDIVDVLDGPDHPYWLIETSIYRVWWPAGFIVGSPHDAGDGTPFYLHGPDETTIFPQGPVAKERLTGPDALVAAGQTVLSRRAEGNGTSVIELSYELGDEAWWQGHWAIPFGPEQAVLITVQAPSTHLVPARDAAQEVAARFERRS
jgi:hypothetical protein